MYPDTDYNKLISNAENKTIDEMEKFFQLNTRIFTLLKCLYNTLSNISQNFVFWVFLPQKGKIEVFCLKTCIKKQDSKIKNWCTEWKKKIETQNNVKILFNFKQCPDKTEYEDLEKLYNGNIPFNVYKVEGGK